MPVAGEIDETNIVSGKLEKAGLWITILSAD
jgi:hypothetical protein